ncbi:DUF4118 domain-containing protein [Streptomyces kutzneri]|uniref:DUF4118 domain-containing protein n=1 Tax=Streptomyces kutzneri TaxID=3051179 RepID=UPI0028D67882|nr:DUF4118 domain-containing protein [Streptomyces sp. DSM 40907]
MVRLFLTRPYQRFTITDPDDIQTAVLLLVVGLLVAQLAVRVRRLEVVTVTGADHLSRLHATARLAQRAGSPEAVVDHVRGDLTELLELRGCRFAYGSLLGRPPRLEHDGSVSVAAPGIGNATAGPRARSNCASAATVTTTAGSCSPPRRVRCLRSRHAGWPRHSPT